MIKVECKFDKVFGDLVDNEHSRCWACKPHVAKWTD